jgi:hypothetical protein
VLPQLLPQRCVAAQALPPLGDSVKMKFSRLFLLTLIVSGKNGGHTRFNDPAFKNQGDCIQYFNTGK